MNTDATAGDLIDLTNAQRVTILGGFEDGTVGTINACRLTDGRWLFDVIMDDGTQLAGFHAGRLNPTPRVGTAEHNGMRYRTRTWIGNSGRPVYTVDVTPIDPEHWAAGVWEPVASRSAHDLDSWPATPYCAGQRAALIGKVRVSPIGLTGGACDGGAGEWFAGYDDARIGRFYG